MSRPEYVFEHGTFTLNVPEGVLVIFGAKHCPATERTKAMSLWAIDSADGMSVYTDLQCGCDAENTFWLESKCLAYQHPDKPDDILAYLRARCVAAENLIGQYLATVLL